jgi:hypothetical protein
MEQKSLVAFGTEPPSLHEGFPQFGDLPAEIRHVIWDSHFLDEDPPAVHLMTLRWFGTSSITTSFGPYAPERTVDGTVVTKRRLQEVALTDEGRSLLHVCKESRGRAMAWAAAWGYELFYRFETQGHIFVRDFDPKRDVVFLPFSDSHWLSRLGRKPDDVTVEEHRQRLLAFLKEALADVQHLAYPAWTICNEGWEELYEVPYCTTNVKTITAVWDTWPQKYPSGNGSDGNDAWVDEKALVLPRWELHPVTSRTVRAVTPMTMAKTWSYTVAENMGEFEEEQKRRLSTMRIPHGNNLWPEHMVNYDTGEVQPKILSRRMVWRWRNKILYDDASDAKDWLSGCM